LRLGLPRVGSDALFAPIFARFRALYPGIEVELYEAGSARLRESCTAANWIWPGCCCPCPTSLKHRNWRANLCWPCCPPRIRWPRKAASLPELAALPLILFDSGFVLHAMITQAFRAQRLDPACGRTHQPDRLHAGAGGGRGGVAFLPAMIARLHARPGIALVPLADPRWNGAWRWHGGAMPIWPMPRALAGGLEGALIACFKVLRLKKCDAPVRICT
jgi:DNA-binding transcriptional LysR family regulator